MAEGAAGGQPIGVGMAVTTALVPSSFYSPDDTLC